MSVELMQGYTGSGKSLMAMRKVRQHLIEGGVVGLNFRLTEDWAYIMAADHPRVLKGLMSYEDCVESLYNRCFFVGRPETLETLVEHYTGSCVGYAKKRRERKILVVIDEAQLYLNTRDYRQNAPWVQLFTQHRKMGLDLILLAHHINFIDNQARHLISFLTRVVNLHEEFRIPGTDVRFPFPFFILITRPRLGGRSHVRFATFQLKIAELYDSFEIFGFDTLSGVVERQGVFSRACSLLGVCKRSGTAPPELLPGRYWLNFLNKTDKDSLTDPAARPARGGGIRQDVATV
jgi:hypothetical protein